MGRKFIYLSTKVEQMLVKIFYKFYKNLKAGSGEFSESKTCKFRFKAVLILFPSSWHSRAVFFSNYFFTANLKKVLLLIRKHTKNEK